MAKKIFSQSRFTGGIAEGTKIGYENSYNDGERVDFRQDPDRLTILPKLAKDSGTTVVDLPKWAVSYQNYEFFYGSSGHIYRRTNAGVWSDQRTVGNGQGLAIFNTLNTDAMWYSQSDQIGRATTLTGSINFDDDYIDTIDQNIDQSDTLGTYSSTYSTPASISEVSTAKRSFIPAKVMLESIEYLVATKGNGNVVVTVHDPNNNTIGTATVTPANMTNGFYARAIFSTPLELIKGVQYHFHLHVPSGTATTVSTSSGNDLSTAAYRTITPVLTADSNWHPIKEFLNLMCIGNGRFLATLSTEELYNSERLEFPKGWKVRSLEVVGSLLAIGLWADDSIAARDRSLLILWDGVSPRIREVIPIDGQINAQTSLQNLMQIIHGSRGKITTYSGALTPKRELKNIEYGRTVEIYPGAVTTWMDIMYMGISGGTSEEIKRMVWSYGRMDNDYPNALTKDFSISTGNNTWNNTTQKGVTIGCLHGVSPTKFFVGWKDSTTGTDVYGVDNIDTTKQQSDAFVDFLRNDAGEPYRTKFWQFINITHAPLKSGQSIEVYYRMNQDTGDFHLIGTVSFTKGQNSVGHSFSLKVRSVEMEIRVRLVSNDLGEAPSLASVNAVFSVDPITESGNITATSYKK